jgi:LysM repeat protein
MNAKILPSTRWIDELFVPEDLELDDRLASVYETEIAARQEELTNEAQYETEKDKARVEAIKKANAVKIYVVKSGDTLGHIAQRHKVTVSQLKKWNGLKSDFLRVGQKLKIEN